LDAITMTASYRTERPPSIFWSAGIRLPSLASMPPTAGAISSTVTRAWSGLACLGGVFALGIR
jgi:hypothetical protein